MVVGFLEPVGYGHGFNSLGKANAELGVNMTISHCITGQERLITATAFALDEQCITDETHLLRCMRMPARMYRRREETEIR